MSEHVFDLLIIFVLFIALYRGAAKGFVWQLATIAAIVLCFVFAGELSKSVAPVMANFGAKPPLDQWLAMLALYVGFSFLSFGVARSLSNWLEKAKLKEYDKHLGAVFGLIKGAAFCLILIFFAVSASASAREMIQKSYSGKAAAIVMDRLHPIMPKGLSDALHKVTDIHGLDQPGLDLKHHHHDEDGHHDHDHDSSHDDDPWKNANPFNKSENKQEIGYDFLDNFVKSLPGAKDNKTQNSILRILKNSTPQDRDKMIESLRKGAGLNDFIQSHTRDWFDDTSAKKTETVSNSNRENLLKKISELQSSSASRQREIVTNAHSALQGVPANIADKVVADWYADLYGLETDPDPRTDFDTPINERIVRQAKAANIPLSSLPAKYRR